MEEEATLGPPPGEGSGQGGGQACDPSPGAPNDPTAQALGLSFLCCGRSSHPKATRRAASPPGPQTGNGCDAPEGTLLPFTPEVPREGKQQQWSLSVPRFQPFSPISRHSKQQFSRLQPLSQQTRSSLNGGLGQGEGCHSEPWESLGSEEGLPSSLTSPLSPCAPTYPHLP